MQVETHHNRNSDDNHPDIGIGRKEDEGKNETEVNQEKVEGVEAEEEVVIASGGKLMIDDYQTHVFRISA